jgi:hypothetical protein
MTVKAFTIGCAKTINLGNFQSLRIESSVTMELGPEDHLSEAAYNAVKDAAQHELRRLLDETYRAQYKAKTEGNPYT